MFNFLGVKETQKDSFVYYIIFKYIIIHTCVYESYLYCYETDTDDRMYEL